MKKKDFLNVVEKEMDKRIKETKNLDKNYQDIVTYFHTHAELCGKEEIVYREDVVMLLIKKFWENGYSSGYTKGYKDLIKKFWENERI